MPRQPLNEEADDHTTTTRWTLLVADVGILLYFLLVMYSIIALSLSLPSTEVLGVRLSFARRNEEAVFFT